VRRGCGAVSIVDNAYVQMYHSIVRDSHGNFGGRIYVEGSDLTLSRSVVRNNMAGHPPRPADVGGVTQKGGGIASVVGTVTIKHSSILAENDMGDYEDYLDASENYSPDCYSPQLYDLKSYCHYLVGELNNNCSMTDYNWGNDAWITYGTSTNPLNPYLAGPYCRSGDADVAPEDIGFRFYRPSSYSDAVDNGGDFNIYPCLDIDVKGDPRPAGDVCDIGSIERQY
jgi:hypothetical protein